MGTAAAVTHGGVHDRPCADGCARRRRRPCLAQPCQSQRAAGELETIDAEVYLVELKAAAIDVVAETALARGAQVILAANEVVSPSSTSGCQRSSRRGACAHERRLDEAHPRAEAPTCAAPERMMTEPRRIMPLPLGGGEFGLPYSRGLDGALAHGRRIAAHRAYALRDGVGDDSRADAARRRSTPPARGGLRRRRARRGGGPRKHPAPVHRYHDLRDSTCRSSSSSAARPAPASRPSPPSSHTASGSRASPRQTSSARRYAPSSERLHAGDPPLKLRGGRPVPRRRRPGRVRVHVAVAERQRRRARVVGACARGGVVARPRGRRISCRASSSCHAPTAPSRCSPFSRSRTRTSTRATSTYREEGPNGPSPHYLERFDDIRILQEIIVERAHAEGVPVIRIVDADRAARTVADLVLDAADRSKNAK